MNISKQNSKVRLSDHQIKKENMDIIPKYELSKPNFSNEEKILLGELRDNLVDLAILLAITSR